VAGQEFQVDLEGPSYGPAAPEYEKTKNGHGDPEQQVHEQPLAGKPAKKVDIHEFGTAHLLWGKLSKKDSRERMMLLTVDENAIFVDGRRRSPGNACVDLLGRSWAISGVARSIRC
jgi:hypothetical protein